MKKTLIALAVFAAAALGASAYAQPADTPAVRASPPLHQVAYTAPAVAAIAAPSCEAKAPPMKPGKAPGRDGGKKKCIEASVGVQDLGAAQEVAAKKSRKKTGKG